MQRFSGTTIGLSSLAVLLTVAMAIGQTELPTKKSAAKPNIIFILADDLGYGDVGVTFQNARDQSKPHFTTPNLDAMAAGGMVLHQHYTGSPVCAPARASLLLGQHQGDCPIRDNQFDKALPNNHTLATVMKAAGYHTVAIGKWGLQGEAPSYPGHPLRHGFDEFFGFLAHMSGHTYYHDAAHPLHDGFNDVTAQYTNVYSTDLFTARAKRFLIDHAAHSPSEPFFLYLAYTAPHMPQQVPGEPYPASGGVTGGLQWPLSPTPKTQDKWFYPEYADQPGWTDRMKRYATVIHRMDQAVGDIAQTLKDLKIDQNTMVVFTSDNGPSNEGIDPRKFDSWGPFDGFKRDVWEGGVREPTIVRWPGHVAPHVTTEQVSGFWDWMPTFADAAGLAAPAQADGVSLLPTLTGVGTQRSRGFIYEDYFFHSPPNPKGVLADVYARKHVTGRDVQQMLREGDYVAVRTQVRSAADPLRLYNVVTDPHEDRNLAGDPQYAAKLQKMTDDLAGVRRPDAESPRPYDSQLLPSTMVETTSSGLAADVYTGNWPWVPDLEALQPVRRTQVFGADVSTLSLSPGSAVKLSGFIKIPTNGKYSFWLTDDGGAQLWIHEAHVLDDDFNHTGAPVFASIDLSAGLHPVRLFYRHVKETPSLRLEIAGPGLPRQIVPQRMLVSASRPTPDQSRLH